MVHEEEGIIKPTTQKEPKTSYVAIRQTVSSGVMPLCMNTPPSHMLLAVSHPLIRTLTTVKSTDSQ